MLLCCLLSGCCLQFPPLLGLGETVSRSHWNQCCYPLTKLQFTGLPLPFLSATVLLQLKMAFSFASMYLLNQTTRWKENDFLLQFSAGKPGIFHYVFLGLSHEFTRKSCVRLLKNESSVKYSGKSSKTKTKRAKETMKGRRFIFDHVSEELTLKVTWIIHLLSNKDPPLFSFCELPGVKDVSCYNLSSLQHQHTNLFTYLKAVSSKQDKFSWSRASEICQTLDGHFPVTRNREELNQTFQVFKDVSVNTTILFLGLKVRDLYFFPNLLQFVSIRSPRQICNSDMPFFLSCNVFDIVYNKND